MVAAQDLFCHPELVEGSWHRIKREQPASVYCPAKILRRQKKLAPRRSRAKRDGFVFAPSFFLSKSKPLH